MVYMECMLCIIIVFQILIQKTLGPSIFTITNYTKANYKFPQFPIFVFWITDFQQGMGEYIYIDSQYHDVTLQCMTYDNILAFQHIQRPL